MVSVSVFPLGTPVSFHSPKTAVRLIEDPDIDQRVCLYHTRGWESIGQCAFNRSVIYNDDDRLVIKIFQVSSILGGLY